MSTSETISSNSSGGGNTKPPRKKQISPSKKWCFTLNFDQKSNSSEVIGTLVRELDHLCLKYVFQEEEGASGNHHLQGLVVFRKKIRPRGHFTCKHIHWEKCRNESASIAYCSDPSKRRDGGNIWVRGFALPQTLRCISKENFYPWQKSLFEVVTGEPDDRSINWIYESTGNVGKSAFCRYLGIHHDAIIVSGKAADVKYMLFKYYEKHGCGPNIILYDIPRCNENYVSWQALESIKNGNISSTKYESECFFINPPHILCFSNFAPNIEKLSKDRWHIFKIQERDLIKKVF